MVDVQGCSGMAVNTDLAAADKETYCVAQGLVARRDVKRLPGCELIFIHHNNPAALQKSMATLGDDLRAFARISIVDNGSTAENADRARQVAHVHAARFLSGENLGWGAAINAFVSNQCEYELLAIAAHDSHFIAFDPTCFGVFDDQRVGAASAQYSFPLACRYSLARGFSVVPLRGNSEPQILNGTFSIFRVAALVESGGFDENAFMYGCEAEIFLRTPFAQSKKAYLNNVIVDNPTTDSEGAFVVAAFTVNSLYIAKKQGGIAGFTLRALVVLVSSIRHFASGDSDRGRVKLHCLAWSVKEGGKVGFRQYRIQNLPNRRPN